MKDYREIFKDMIKKYDIHIKKCLDNDLSDYCYKKDIDKEYGTYDLNYYNRLRLSYAILFSQDRNNINMEELIRKLFCEELKDRKTRSFQGIGTNLLILSQLLHSYQKEEDKILFEEATNANFDCYAGYEYDLKLYNEMYPISKKIDEYDLFDCIYIAHELMEYNISEQLIDILEAQRDSWHIIKDKRLENWEELKNRFYLV